MENNTSADDVRMEFKMPVLIGKVGRLPKKALNIKGKRGDTSKMKTESPTESFTSTNSLPPAVSLKEMSTPIPYKEPKWSGLCPDGSDYALEVLKSGVIVEKIELIDKPYYVFGRILNCDIVMAHPTISRHHCVLQYKAFAKEGEPHSGWYLYDLGSTHGTYLNKEKIKPNHYTRVKVGHQIKFGTSTRTYILLGPDFDCDGESELTVTEIKQKALEMKLERQAMIKSEIEQKQREKAEEERKLEETGIDWGMGEDAEDEPDLADNPYASTANEELYLDDPKKTLRGYFEREGEELQYNCEERGVGQFICRVVLPLDDASGRSVTAEVIHRGKKKDAVVACALEACRILDRAGLLRQAKHESRRRKARDWSADDYYDSDEDSYLDRTGAVERKRRKRMIKHGAVQNEDAQSDKPLTYDDLVKQISELESKIRIEEKNLEALRASKQQLEEQSWGDIDDLDQFMNNLGTQRQSMAKKTEISNVKMNIKNLQAELAKAQKLADIARPAHMPPLIKKDDKKSLVKIGSNSVIYGKRIRLKDDDQKKLRPERTRISEQKEEEAEFEEEIDSDEEELNLTTVDKTARQTMTVESPKRDSVCATETQHNNMEVDADQSELRGNENEPIDIPKWMTEKESNHYINESSIKEDHNEEMNARKKEILKHRDKTEEFSVEENTLDYQAANEANIENKQNNKNSHERDKQTSEEKLKHDLKGCPGNKEFDLEKKDKRDDKHRKTERSEKYREKEKKRHKSGESSVKKDEGKDINSEKKIKDDHDGKKSSSISSETEEKRKHHKKKSKSSKREYEKGADGKPKEKSEHKKKETSSDKPKDEKSERERKETSSDKLKDEKFDREYEKGADGKPKEKAEHKRKETSSDKPKDEKSERERKETSSDKPKDEKSDRKRKETSDELKDEDTRRHSKNREKTEKSKHKTSSEERTEKSRKHKKHVDSSKGENKTRDDVKQKEKRKRTEASPEKSNIERKRKHSVDKEVDADKRTVEYETNRNDFSKTEISEQVDVNVVSEQSPEKCSTKEEKGGSSNLDESNDSIDKKEKTTKVYGPMGPPENYVIPENYYEQCSDRDLPEITDENTPSGT